MHVPPAATTDDSGSALSMPRTLSPQEVAENQFSTEHNVLLFLLLTLFLGRIFILIKSLVVAPAYALWLKMKTYVAYRDCESLFNFGTESIWMLHSFAG
jgi:hypothetical protein